MTPSGSRFNRVAHAIVHRYPAPWRERYEAEVLSLIEDSPVRLGDLAEFVRGLIVERARATIEDADHPSRTAALLASLRPVFVIAFMAGGWSAGVALRTLFGTAPFGLAEAAFWGNLSISIGLSLTKIVLGIRRRKYRRAFRVDLPAWPGVAFLPVLFAGLAFGGWGNWAGLVSPGMPMWFRELYVASIFCFAVADLSSAFWPGRRMLEAIGRVAGAESQIKSAQRWVDDCNDLIAQGFESPLDEAQAQVDRFRRECEVAVEQLQQLGYRARFQQPS